MSMVTDLRHNERPFGMLSAVAQHFMCQLGTRAFQVYDSNGKWTHTTASAFFLDDTYRLDPAWRCQHNYGKIPGTNMCVHCDAPIGKGMWVVYKVSVSLNKLDYVYTRSGVNYFLASAPGAVGYGGIQWREPRGERVTEFVTHHTSPEEHQGPWVPVTVRFWEEVE